MVNRRMERTTDPAKLAAHLAAAIREIGDYAEKVDTADRRRMRNTLNALYHQLHNAAAQVSEAIASLDEAAEFGGVPDWDVVADEHDIEAEQADAPRSPST